MWRQLSAIPKSSQIKRSEHIDNHDLVRCIDIKVLVERERDRVIVEGRIRTRPVFLNGGMREPCEELDDVPRTQSTRSRRAGAVAVVEVEVKCVLEALPLGLSEETAEGGVAKGHRLFKAQMVQKCQRSKKKWVDVLRMRTGVA